MIQLKSSCWRTIVLTLLCIQLVFPILNAQKIPIAQKNYTSEIKKLNKKKQIQAAFSIIDEIDDQTTEDLITLTEIEAPPFKEGKRAKAFKTMLEQTEMDKVWIDEVGNVIGLKKGDEGNRVVVLDAHLDTVFPEGTNVTVKKKG